MDRWLVHKMGIVFFLFILFTFSAAEKVGKLTYIGKPENINDSTVEVPSEAVVMSEKVLVSQNVDIVEGIIDSTTPPSIFFVIDHSGSMFYKDFNMDRWGNRFTKTKEFIDTINRVFPEAEIGLAVFGSYLYFDKQDDNALFVELDSNPSNYHDGAFIPLRQLNKNYSYDGGTASGYDIISHYLQTKEDSTTNSKQTFTNLLYSPTAEKLAGTSTNITAGFEAAKQAFKSTTKNKRNHYVIFFSDGIAKAPSDATEQNKFQKGDSVPTTFTIYFEDSNNGVPDAIQTMTENIKNNKYSTSNDSTKAWAFDNSGNDTLMEFLLQNVLSVITTENVSTPDNITVNGSTPDGKPDNVGDDFIYTFSSAFPFEGEENNFKYVIKYNGEKIDPDNPDNKVPFDTTVTSNFTIKLTDDATLDDSLFTLEYWDRSIKFYDQNGTQLSSLYEAVENLEVRFEVKKVDIFYKYEKERVVLDIISVDSSKDANGNLTGIKILDKESLTLESISSTDSTEIFSATIPIVLDEYKQNNNKLETDFKDDFYFTFRNNNDPKLPLDTLVEHILFSVSGIIEMNNAYYYDYKDADGNRGADGLVDSIYISLINIEEIAFDDEDLEKFLNNLKLPAYRDFEIESSSILYSGISLSVNEKAKRLNTAIHEDEIIQMDQIILDFGFVSKKDIVPQDQMAPVIVSARAIQYEAESDSTIDTLIVKFSESVEDINFNEPFLFMDSKTELNYNSVELTFLKNNEDSREVSFQIDQINRANEVINNGDSIWINTVGSSVMDNTDKKLAQQEENNIKRPIEAFYVVKPFDIEVKVTGPIDFINPDDNSAIDIKIIEKLDPENLEQLKQTGDDEFHGLLIVGETIQADDEDPKDIELKGDFAIYDYLGNTVWKASKMTFDDDTKTLYYVWNGKNSKGRIVGSGTYVSVMNIKTISTISGEVTDERNIKKFLNVKN